MPELELTYVRSEVVVQTFTYIKFCTAILQEAQLHRQDATRVFREAQLHRKLAQERQEEEFCSCRGGFKQCVWMNQWRTGRDGCSKTFGFSKD